MYGILHGPVNYNMHSLEIQCYLYLTKFLLIFLIFFFFFFFDLWVLLPASIASKPNQVLNTKCLLNLFVNLLLGNESRRKNPQGEQRSLQEHQSFPSCRSYQVCFSYSCLLSTSWSDAWFDWYNTKVSRIKVQCRLLCPLWVTFLCQLSNEWKSLWYSKIDPCDFCVLNELQVKFLMTLKKRFFDRKVMIYLNCFFNNWH